MSLALVGRALLAAFLIVASVCGAGAQPLQPVPALTGHVIDRTDTLDAAARASLEATLVALERDQGAQVVVLFVPSTAPEDIVAYANRVGNAWKIGRAGIGDGLILLVAKDDRRVRIEVTKTLEGAVPDIAASRLIDEVITPAFRRGDYAAGVGAAVDQIAARIRGEPLPPVPAHGGGSEPDALQLLILAFFLAPVASAVLRSLFGRRLGALATGAGAGGLALWLGVGLAMAVLVGLGVFVFTLMGHAMGPIGRGSRGGGWGGGGGFGSGGGFRSGGGGDFGGGGASGSW